MLLWIVEQTNLGPGVFGVWLVFTLCCIVDRRQR